jgi:hypothetical protein
VSSVAEYNRAYYKANRELIKARSREYYRANRQAQIAWQGEYNARRMGNRPADIPWPTDDIGYSAAHKRVKMTRGRPGEHPCVDCGQQADDWSYRHGSDKELVGPANNGWVMSAPYSPDPVDYDPRCKACHRNYDLTADRQPVAI